MLSVISAPTVPWSLQTWQSCHSTGVKVGECLLEMGEECATLPFVHVRLHGVDKKRNILEVAKLAATYLINHVTKLLTVVLSQHLEMLLWLGPSLYFVPHTSHTQTRCGRYIVYIAYFRFTAFLMSTRFFIKVGNFSSYTILTLIKCLILLMD